jgi:hypothetical protein
MQAKKLGSGAIMTQRTAVVDQGIREYPDVQVSNPASPTKLPAKAPAVDIFPKYYVPAKYRKAKDE